MTPISSINQVLVYDQRLRFNELQRARAFEDAEHTFTDNIQQTRIAPTKIDLINQLPHDQVRDVTDIFRSINILAYQALEPGLDFRSRESLQVGVEEHISEIRPVLDNFTQNDLTLFIAIFQNQISEAFVGSSRTSNNSQFDQPFNEIQDNSLESLLSLNVLTESGALNTLDLTGRIIDNFLGNDDFSILEFLLDDLVYSLFNGLSQAQESEAVTAFQDTEISQDTNTEEPDIPRPPINSTDLNPPTIIELAG